MAVKPILFNTEMVQAIQDGRKTVTRRIIKPRYREDESGFQVVKHVVGPDKWGNWYVEKIDYDEMEFSPQRYVNPPYAPGDILYVRETWSEWIGGYLYKAWTDPEPQPRAINPTWHPSIHMPKEAARIWLRVTNVRVERLQDISGGDLLKEGIVKSLDGYMKEHFAAFKELWDSTLMGIDLNDYGWNANPHVWVIEFKRCEKPE